MQRLFWVPAFKEKYEGKYRDIAIMFYLHLLLTIVALSYFTLGGLFFDDLLKYVKPVFIPHGLFTIIRWRYQVAIARSVTRKKKR